MKKLIFILLLVTVLSPLCLSQQEDVRFYHERGTNLTIYEKCRVDGATCDSSFDCNLTILSPSQELIINNELMNGPDVYYNYSLNTSQTENNGIYESTVDCTNSTNSGSNTFFYQITPDGSKPIDEGQSIILLSGIALFMLVAVSVGWMGFKLNNGAVGLSLISLSVILFVFGIGMIFNVVELSFGTFTGLVNNFSTIYVLSITLVSIGGFALVVWLVVHSLQLYHKNRGMTDPAFRE